MTEDRKYKLTVAILFVVISAVVVAFFLIMSKFGSEEAEKIQTEIVPMSVEDDEYSTKEKWAEGVITYGGEQYKYNNQLKTYLLMGIDVDDVVKSAKDYQSGGQSDAMFLLITNPTTKSGKVFSINRDTMTEIDYYDKDGTYRGKTKAQICVQHGFGDGKKLSCNLAKDAVARLFYNIPIDGYLAINVGAVPYINDFVGGVEVEVLGGLEGHNDFHHSVGEKVTLSGREAYYYLRSRNTNVSASAEMRLERQVQYIGAYLPLFLDKLSSDKNASLMLYDQVDPYLETNIDAVTLLNDLSSYDFDTDNIYSVAGKMEFNSNTNFEEYIVDEKLFYKDIIEVFYEKVK